MKTRDIARQYGVHQQSFDFWLRQSGYRYRTGLTGLVVEEGYDIGAMVVEFGNFVDEENERAKIEQEAQAKQREIDERADGVRQQEMAQMLITSGFNFDGYTITKYSGYISGDDAVSVNRPRDGWSGPKGDVGEDLLLALAHIRRNALNELKMAAHALGCNAVIGVDFDYLTLDPETATSSGGTLYLPFLFAVTANGNAVVIEKN